ncbi:hypothetical protein [Pseudomonas sp. dw_358]|uniref:RcnB family protein n=1 Tax=Pseudomonas sp. dw_358 TaxID=2720083 RepID=UPI001BD2AF50|nr:hypothetical protein [Pseudomonas sp. dw_358]
MLPRFLHHKTAARLLLGVLTCGLLSTTQAAETSAVGTYYPKSGTKIPTRYNVTGLTQRQIDAAGLTTPASGYKWVMIGDKYVQINATDNTVQAVEPTVK